MWHFVPHFVPQSSTSIVARSISQPLASRSSVSICGPSRLMMPTPRAARRRPRAHRRRSRPSLPSPPPPTREGPPGEAKSQSDPGTKEGKSVTRAARKVVAAGEAARLEEESAVGSEIIEPGTQATAPEAKSAPQPATGAQTQEQFGFKERLQSLLHHDLRTHITVRLTVEERLFILGQQQTFLLVDTADNMSAPDPLDFVSATLHCEHSVIKVIYPIELEAAR